MRNSNSVLAFSIDDLDLEYGVSKQKKQNNSSDQIRSAQKKLGELGFDPGPADGIWGQQKKAVEAFQRKRNIEISGNLDGKTLKLLGAN